MTQCETAKRRDDDNIQYQKHRTLLAECWLQVVLCAMALALRWVVGSMVHKPGFHQLYCPWSDTALALFEHLVFYEGWNQRGAPSHILHRFA